MSESEAFNIDKDTASLSQVQVQLTELAEEIHLTLLADVERGLADVEAGRVKTLAELRAKYR